jgi:hypothetical protein
MSRALGMVATLTFFACSATGLSEPAKYEPVGTRKIEAAAADAVPRPVAHAAGLRLDDFDNGQADSMLIVGPGMHILPRNTHFISHDSKIDLAILFEALSAAQEPHLIHRATTEDSRLANCPKPTYRRSA